MPHSNHLLKVPTRGKSFHNITHEVSRLVASAPIQDGICSVFIRHTSASLIIQENADPDVLRDLETFFAKLIPENTSLYRHSMEGPDDMPAHIRSVLTKTTESIPIVQHRLALGTWQGLYLWEHRDRGSHRDIVVHLSGN
ncbi:MAG: secondary thiamine-phosphate synthase enzyme YjbQ [Cyanobacteria bacterium P01_F01_bin.42]